MDNQQLTTTPAPSPDMGEAMHRYMLARGRAVWDHFGAEWMSNVRANIPQINEPSAHRDVLGAPKGLPKHLVDSKQIFIFAAGASLRRLEPDIHKLKGKGIIVATPTVLPWMRHHGLEPEWLLANDSNPVTIAPIKMGGNDKLRLLCPPTIDRRVVKLFPKKNVYWYNSLVQGPDGTVDSSEISSFMQKLFAPREEEGYNMPGIGSWVVQAGCCTNQAVIVAHWMIAQEAIKAERVILMGADYAYWRGLSRVPFYQELRPDKSGGVPFYDPGTPIRIAHEYRPVGHPADAIEWDGMQSSRRMVLYKRSLLLYYIATQVPLFSCSQGILTEIPYVSLEQILRGEYPPIPNPQEVLMACSGFLNEEFPSWFPLNIPPPESTVPIGGSK